MADDRLELLRGTLDLLILKVLAAGQAHGYAIARRIRARSEGRLLVEEGSLYPALHRLERRGWLEAEWGTSEGNRRARFYRLSRTGRRELAERESEWEAMSSAIGRVLRPAGGAEA
jgi:transcriptional regulator